MPSPEVSKEPSKAEFSPKPTNVCFNQLRGSQSLPDLSMRDEKKESGLKTINPKVAEKEEIIKKDQVDVTLTPHVPESLDITNSDSVR